MGCGNCGSGGGKPAGCQSNGGCSSSGCNKMNVFDWLAGIPLPADGLAYNVVEIAFNAGARKEYYRNTDRIDLYKGQMVAVEGVNGFDVGCVNLQGELVKLQMKKYHVADNDELRPILRHASDEDLALMERHKAREQEILVESRAMARHYNLPMKVSQVELQADGKRGIFYYTAETRVDFRELIKAYATEFRLRVEMRQIGARQESGKIGGIGSCGRELCCSTWLSDFKTVNTSAARYQNLAINQTKLSGQCGRLKCCLNYELDTYMDGLKAFPGDCDHLETGVGRAHLQKRDIFRNLMWYSLPGSTRQYPLTIDRVKEIAALNKRGEKPEELGSLDVETLIRPKESDHADKGFVNDVGQVSLKALERSRKKKKAREKSTPDRPAEGRPARERTARAPQNKGRDGALQKAQPDRTRPQGEAAQAPKSDRPARPKSERTQGGNTDGQTKPPEGGRNRRRGGRKGEPGAGQQQPPAGGES